MLRWIWIAFFTIFNRNRIPPLPRGMLATHYDEIPPHARRVMARIGSRDVVGVKLAMKRHKAKTVDELVSKLEHYEAQRRVRERVEQAIGRVVGGTPYPPHQRDIIAAMKERDEQGLHKEIELRVKSNRRAFKELGK